MSVRKLAAVAWLVYAVEETRGFLLPSLLAGEIQLALLEAVFPAIDAAIAWRIWAGQTARPLIAGVLWGGLWLASATAILLDPSGPGLEWTVQIIDWLRLLLLTVATALSLAALVRPWPLAEEERPPP